MNEERGRYQFKPTPEFREALDRRQELKRYSREFLLAGGLMAGHSDGELSAEEHDRLVEALGPLYDDPEGEIVRLESPVVALELLDASMAWLKEHGGDRRLELYRHLAAIVGVDGELDPDESRYMQNVAKGLDIPLNDAFEMINWELSDGS